MIKYRAIWNEIEELDIARETEKFVFFHDGRREAKKYYWHDSWEEAKTFLLDKEETRANSLRKQLIDAVKELEKISLMENPVDEHME